MELYQLLTNKISILRNKGNLKSKILESEIRILENLRAIIKAVERDHRINRGILIYDTAIKILELNLDIFDSEPFWMKWKKLLRSSDFGWEIITHIKPVKEKGISFEFVLPEGHSVITGSGLLI